jgi:serine protease Do
MTVRGRMRLWLTMGVIALGLSHAVASGVTTKAPVLDDGRLWQQFADNLGEDQNGGRTPPITVLRDQLKERSRTRIELVRPSRRTLEATEVYERYAASVVALGSVYKCNRCPHWHTGGTGTGWVIGRNGEVVSNYHVFAEGRNTNVVAVGAMTRDGRCFPIQEVLAADRDRDVAIVRIGARDLVPLAVSPREPVGSPVSVIAHPSGELFTFTQGHISRYMRKTVESGGRPLDWMTVTADFAVGSSGGPVFNQHGAVVGMVARTHTINADPKSESPTTQMVVKMTIPAEDILSLVENGKGRTTNKERR